MSDQLRQALCTMCGTLRTCKRARNYQPENYWLNRPVDLDWSRELGDLKCETCGKVTTHALIHPDGHWAADHAERIQRVALGDRKAYPRFQDERAAKDLVRIIKRYRQGNYPSNPFVFHRWWKSDENKAREAGQKWFPAMCGEPVEVPEEHRFNGTDVTELEAPTQVTDPERTEHENFDVETGLWWTASGVCVNCLRVRNDWLLDKRRIEVATLLMKLAATIDSLDAPTVHKLADLADTVAGGAL